MQLPLQIPAIWVYTTGGYNTLRASGYPDFLTPHQKARAERIRQARLLFDKKHREYFLTERRSQFDFPQMRVAEQVIQPYLAYNALGLISLKGTDLLFGSQPLLQVNQPYQQDALKALAERTNLHQLFYSASLDASYEGEAFIEACVHEGEVYLRQVDCQEIFPVGELQPNGQYAAYKRFNVKNVGTEAEPIFLLLEVTYLVGAITRQCFQLDTKGAKLQAVELNSWIEGADAAASHPQPGGGPPVQGNYTGPMAYGGFAANDAPPAPYADAFRIEPVTRTGINRNTITWVPNQLFRGRAVSDYDIAIDLQDALNAKQTQIARVLAKHADPKLAMPSRMANDLGSAYASDDLFYFDTADEVPKYITWNSELAHAFTDRDFALHNLLVTTETSPVLLGLKEGSHNDAYKKVKVQAMSSLKKAERKSVYWQVGIKRAIGVAQDLENVLPGVRYDREPIGVTLQDGIPLDELDEANRLSILRGAGLLSLRRGIEAQLDDPTAVQAELEELDEENQSKTPSVFFGAPMKKTSQAAQQQILGDEGRAAAAGAAEEQGEGVAA